MSTSLPSPASSGAPRRDAFAVVRAGARAVWPCVAKADGRWTTVARNRVLDECGSDHRPLVDLLLDVGTIVSPRLGAAHVAHDAATWAVQRAPLVHALIATRYLQPAVAGWAVDTWALMLGRIDDTAVRSSEVPQVAMEFDEAIAGPGQRASSAAQVMRVTTPRATPPRATPQRATPPGVGPHAGVVAASHRPSWAGGPVSFGVGAVPTARTLAVLAAQGRSIVPRPVGGPQWLPVDRAAAWVLALLLAVCSGAMWLALQRPRGAADAMPAATANATPAAALDAGPPRSPRTDEPPAAITGQAPPRQPGLTLAAASDTRSVRTLGVGGRYHLTQDVHVVAGSASCTALAEALRGGRTGVETVTHVPGGPTIEFTGSAVAGTLADDGEFSAGPATGRTDNIRWRLQLHGHFTPDGFTAESELHTEAIIRWLSLQRCVVRSTLTAVRADP